MQDAQTVLVIILSVGFALFLIMGCVMVYIAIKVLMNIRNVTQRLDETTENMSEMAKYMGQKVAPAAMAALMQVIVRGVKSKTKRKDREED
jgi:hypothetical protein